MNNHGNTGLFPGCERLCGEEDLQVPRWLPLGEKWVPAEIWSWNSFLSVQMLNGLFHGIGGQKAFALHAAQNWKHTHIHIDLHPQTPLQFRFWFTEQCLEHPRSDKIRSLLLVWESSFEKVLKRYSHPDLKLRFPDSLFLILDSWFPKKKRKWVGPIHIKLPFPICHNMKLLIPDSWFPKNRHQFNFFQESAISNQESGSW